MSEFLFTDRELDVMSILWRAGSGTVAEVRDALGEKLAYTTVLSVLQTLEARASCGMRRRAGPTGITR